MMLSLGKGKLIGTFCAVVDCFAIFPDVSMSFFEFFSVNFGFQEGRPPDAFIQANDSVFLELVQGRHGAPSDERSRIISYRGVRASFNSCTSR